MKKEFIKKLSLEIERKSIDNDIVNKSPKKK